jgi:RNA-binding protein
MKARHELKARAASISPTLQVGKEGITRGVIEELEKQLKKSLLVKVKILKSAREKVDKRDIIRSLAELSGSELVEERGNPAVFCRKR